MAVALLASSAVAGAAAAATAPLLIAWGIPAAAGIAGGFLLGARPEPQRSRAGALLAPLCIVVPLGLLGCAFSSTEADLWTVFEVVVVALVLWEITVAVGFAIASARLPQPDALPTTLDRELRAATASSTIPFVTREYIDDPEGRRHLQSDKARLTANGYEVQTIERTSPRKGVLAVDLVMALAGWESDEAGSKILATFRLRTWNGPPMEAFVEPPRGAVGTLLDLGRDVLVVIGWLIAAIVVVVPMSRLVANLPLGDTGNAIPGLALVATFATIVVVGPVLTIRRLDRRRGR